VNFFVVWRAKAQRRTEIGEDFSDLPKVGKLGTFFYLARKGAEAQRKNPFAALQEYILFFSHKEKEPAVGMHKKGSPNDTSQFVNIGIW
jgi:hypothetical protein